MALGCTIVEWYDCLTTTYCVLHALPTCLRPPIWLPSLLLVLATAAILLPADWAVAIDESRLSAAYSKYRPATAQPFHDWQAMLHENQSSADLEKLRRVNEFFNRRVQFGDDQQIWGKSDYWATPMETLAKGAGDCEDFAIAKYFSLLSLGIPVQQLRLIYVKARIGGPASTLQQAHMVLAYYASPDAEPLVLDNLITEIRAASRRPDLQPVFSFNSEGVFAGAASNATAGPGGISGISRWQELLQRAHAEGFQ